MPRDSNGNYSLPAGYLAEAGQTIQPSQHNPPLEDLGAALTASMPRSGVAPMTGPLKVADGTASAPALTFSSATSSGLLKTAGGFGVSIGGVLVAEFGPAGLVSGVGTASFADNAVTYPKMQKPTGVAKILGSSSIASMAIVGAANNGVGLIRLTVASTATLTSGTTKVVSGVVGTTEANASWVITVIDGTKVDLVGSTFANAYVSGGTLGGSVEEITLGSGLSMIGNQLSACPPGHLYGMTLSNGTDATNDINIAAGKCRDSADTLNISLSAITKQLDSAWAAGTNAGGRSSASLANGTWHVFGIAKPDGTSDVLFHSNPDPSAVLPSGYTVYRRIGSIIRESGAIVPFVQDGDYFQRVTASIDLGSANPGTSAVARTLAVPYGISVIAQIFGFMSKINSTIAYTLISDLDTADQVPAGALCNLTPVSTASGQTAYSAGEIIVRTSTAAQVRTRITYATDLATQLFITTRGWWDSRGRS